jgi:3-oxoacyl-[acyl-carrier-protein] synthase II
MRLALNDAGLRPEQIGYLNADATSTEVGDILEAQGIEDVFGEHAPRLLGGTNVSLVFARDLPA